MVCDPLADNDPTIDADLEWEATLAYRRYLWSLGLSVAEAMDTAQRGMGLGWDTSRELHLSELFVLADRAGLLHDPDLAAERMRRVLAVAGVA